jgi:hypothetical protein
MVRRDAGTTGSGVVPGGGTGTTGKLIYLIIYIG